MYGAAVDGSAGLTEREVGVPYEGHRRDDEVFIMVILQCRLDRGVRTLTYMYPTLSVEYINVFSSSIKRKLFHFIFKLLCFIVFSIHLMEGGITHVYGRYMTPYCLKGPLVTFNKWSPQ